MASNFLNKQLDRLVERSKDDGKTDDVRFSLTLNKFTNRRVEYLRHTLKISKQELLQEIISAAICDLEVKLGLAVFDEKADVSKLSPEYQKVLTSKRPIASHFKDGN